MHNIQVKLSSIINNPSHDEFIFDFLLAYDIPKSTIERARKWDLNKLESIWEFVLRKKVHFKVTDTDLYATIDTIKTQCSNSTSKPRFIIVTDFDKIVAFDTKVWDSLHTDFAKLDKNYDFFLPLIWVEKQQYQNENIADVKAANNLAKLFDEIVNDNDHTNDAQRHALNIFLSRLLFCFFAEDTNIFTATQFTNSLASHTKVDWSDTDIFLEQLFEIFNISQRDDWLEEYLKGFPYVNGKLFEKNHEIPKFTTKSRKLLIELWQLDWSGINPDIFWSMMQAVMDSKERSNLWSHYTSVPNIMKVIQPLFLDELCEVFEQCNGNHGKLRALLTRISKIKFFDPACGSGNFLIIAYKEIRRLEIEIFKEVWVWWLLTKSEISLSQFYGIEINDFAHETAKLSLYLAEHQMNIEFEKAVGITTVSLPLKLWGNIVCGNACRKDREEVCPKHEWDEIYIMGNPPYLWYSLQNDSQKMDIEHVFSRFTSIYKELDYISCWFYKWTKYLEECNVKMALVSTNSISQWEQVWMLWPYILTDKTEIFFAHQSFKWSNNAKWNANVIVVIIWIWNKSKSKKYLFTNYKSEVDNINAYLTTWSNIIIEPRNNTLSWFPKMVLWSMAKDNWNLFLDYNEKKSLLEKYPESNIFIKITLWSSEFINMQEKYCLWIEDKDIELANEIPPIKKRLDNIVKFRLESKAKSTRDYSIFPNRFKQRTHKNTNSIIMPRVSSERREYIPTWFLSNDIVVKDSAYAIYDATLYIFWIVNSKMHMVWMRTFSGKLKNDYRYSSTIVYNTFPFPSITKKQKEEIEEYVYAVLDEREKHTEKTLAQMYDPDKMPEWLKSAHHELDLAIERCYRPKPFESDEERLEYLFKLYERMIAKGKGESK